MITIHLWANCFIRRIPASKPRPYNRKDTFRHPLLSRAYWPISHDLSVQNRLAIAVGYHIEVTTESRFWARTILYWAAYTCTPPPPPQHHRHTHAHARTPPPPPTTNTNTNTTTITTHPAVINSAIEINMIEIIIYTCCHKKVLSIVIIISVSILFYDNSNQQKLVFSLH